MVLPTLETTRLILRPWSLDDIDALHQMWIDPWMRRYLWDDEAVTRERAAAAVEAGVASARERGIGFWCARRKPAHLLAGFCGFRPIGDSADIELLYGLLPAHCGQGLATEAARAALDYAFSAGLFSRVYARTDVPNRASVRVLERLGMRFERETQIGALPTLIYSLSQSS